jgi:hypothetical protein
MPGPKPTPSSHFFFTDPRTLGLIALIAVLAAAVIYLLMFKR